MKNIPIGTKIIYQKRVGLDLCNIESETTSTIFKINNIDCIKILNEKIPIVLCEIKIKE